MPGDSTFWFGLFSLALAALTFFVGRKSVHKKDGEEWGTLKSDIKHIKGDIEEIKSDVKDTRADYMKEYQFFDESITFNRVKKYVIDNYDRLPLDDAPEQFNLFSDLIGERKRTEMEGDRRWNALKESWSRYVQWETQSRDLYESKAKELFDAGLVTDAKFVQDLAAGVSEELATVKDIYLALSGMDFDLPTITSMQLDMAEKWERKKRKLFKEPS